MPTLAALLSPILGSRLLADAGQLATLSRRLRVCATSSCSLHSPRAVDTVAALDALDALDAMGKQ